MNILLFESELEVQSILTTFLEIRGHHVTECHDAESGWTAFQTQNFPLAIVDCSMPGGYGIELCQKIRSAPYPQQCFILAITARTKLNTLDQVLAAGADDYLEKPIDLLHLSVRLSIAEQRINAQQYQAKRAESLREREKILNIAMESGGYGVWNYNCQRREVVHSKAGKAMLGFVNDEAGRDITDWEARIHPDDRQKWIVFLRALIHKNEDRYSIEYRVRGKDESWKWILTHGIVVSRAEDSKVLRIIGTHHDITARKNADQEQQFTNSVYQAVGKAVVITDSSNNIISVNQAFTELSGYSSNEVVGKDLSFIYSERYNETFNQMVLHKLNNTGIWEGEISNCRKNGEEYNAWQLTHTVYDDIGNVSCRVTLFSDVTDQKRTEEKIRRQADYDLLTRLPNRRLFEDRLGLEIKKAKRANLTFALLFIDLDRFKEVNDKLGHIVGDRLLQLVARRISDCVRESDTVARLGGDEFTVILSEVPDIRHIDSVAQKIVSSLAKPYHITGKVINDVSSSIGITQYPNDADSIGALLDNADQAMYVAKRKGRNQFSHFISMLNQAEQERVHLNIELRRALPEKQFKLYFQPIVSMSNGRINKAEALLRWQHPVHGMLNPSEFIPLAEDTGLINQIGDWVFKESANYAKRWSEQFSPDFQVSVNITPVQMKVARKNNVAEWSRYLDRTGLAGSNMAVEICEEPLLNAEPEFMANLRAFRDTGIQVSIDNFGTDYSSLSQYKKSNIDFLKIDQSTILTFAADPNDMALSQIIVMAHKIGLKVIAEGVETEQQHNLLTAAGCDFAQGNLYSCAVLPEGFEALLQRDAEAQTKAEGNDLSKEPARTLFTEQEAVDFLQPHMGSKSVKSWLANDRQHDPIIPYIHVEGKPCYLQSDLEDFVARTLNKAARLFRVNNRNFIERRSSHDRRRADSNESVIGMSPQNRFKRRRRSDLVLHLQADAENCKTVLLDRRVRTNQTVH